MELSEEEKKAFKELEDFIDDNEIQNISVFTAEKIKNIIENQQKEIEELKKQNYEIVKELKPRVQIDDTEYIERNFISKDKIRRTIEELEKHLITKSDEFTINVLKDLLGE